MILYFFGGTFDPPHVGHLAIAERCASECDLFLFTPAHQSPHKSFEPIASGQDRAEMLRIMIKDLNNCEIDTWEQEQQSPSYTIHTIKHLQGKYPQTDLHLILGLDQLTTLHTWHRFEEVLENVKLVCFNRGGYRNIQGEFQTQIKLIEDFDYPVSATMIREMLSNQAPEVRRWIHPGVFEFIQKHQLYT